MIAEGVRFTVTVVVDMQPLATLYVMIAVPEDTPVITPPVPAPATAVLPLLHVPPAVMSPRVVVPDTHSDVVPVMPAGDASTVSTRVALHVPPKEYVMLVVPADTPVSTPVEDTIVPTAVLLLLHDAAAYRVA